MKLKTYNLIYSLSYFTWKTKIQYVFFRIIRVLVSPPPKYFWRSSYLPAYDTKGLLLCQKWYWAFGPTKPDKPPYILSNFWKIKICFRNFFWKLLRISGYTFEAKYQFKSIHLSVIANNLKMMIFIFFLESNCNKIQCK